jgi:hypothetical protein
MMLAVQEVNNSAVKRTLIARSETSRLYALDEPITAVLLDEIEFAALASKHTQNVALIRTLGADFPMTLWRSLSSVNG